MGPRRRTPGRPGDLIRYLGRCTRNSVCPSSFAEGRLRQTNVLRSGFMTAPEDGHRRAFADESCQEATAGGCNVLAAAVLESTAREDAIAAMKMLRGRRRGKKLHWNEMDARQRRGAAETVAALPGFHVVTVGTPVSLRRQERARVACLQALVWELRGDGIQQLMMEAWSPELDARDVRTVIGARYMLPKSSTFRTAHQPGAEMPLFWVADIVAGAVRSAHVGRAGPTGMRSGPGLRGRRRTGLQIRVRPGSRSAPGAPGRAARTSPTVLCCLPN